ncbi:fructan beta-fructosidase [Paenibacillus sophorae]|uniref:Fructan beta-fructosidase n=1 Tax=Paenibacillus sophorae TaxID=1333845 RepID=A0A1H8G8A1_9BACL|nr:glycoside hydrolase family 32 protein [Paenibacillus sophorae]QWU14135.1 glycoside hydrolase family 32 protein [Paenibacillus sophorae]SEN40242.1 fructan beta-fructosidase [Paenibacillus sophorae]
MNKDKYRPLYHFTPRSHWMNDPNGMVYFNGEYHLFYQYHPFGMTWGPMHWGHAVSHDMVHWQHLLIALAPDEHGQIFSGSAVVDWNDTSGFFGGKPGLVAIFTHHDEYPGTERQRERQSLAYSSDNGRTWIKYSGNPVLEDPRYSDYRDPKVFWHEASGRWIMILATGQTVCIYTSPNLMEWTFASEFGEGHGSHDGVWECPDLFELVAPGNPQRTKWVLLVSIGDAVGIPEGSRTQYFVGHFDGKLFVNERDPEAVYWLDHGRDNYAGVSFSDIPAGDGRRIYLGWMSNWKYAKVTPTEGWRGAMTIPRELSLRAVDGEIRLIQRPIAELSKLAEETLLLKGLTIEGNMRLMQIKGDSYLVDAEFVLGSATSFGFRVRVAEEGNRATIVGYDSRSGELYVDRASSGEVLFHELFPGKHGVALVPRDNRLRLQLWVDRSSVEVFSGGGECVITDLIFPDPQDDGLEIFAHEGNVELLSLKVTRLNSI